MLGWRLAISAFLIPAFLGMFYLDQRLGPTAPVLFVLTQLLSLRASWELVDLLAVRQFRPRLSLVAASNAVLLCAAWTGRMWGPADLAMEAIVLTFVLCVLALFAAAMVRYREPGGNLETLAAEILGITYIGLLLGITAQLRWIPAAAPGYLALGSLVIAAKLGDVGGYTAGRLFGRRKMSPYVSPGKTWAGGIGAIVGAAAGAVLWSRIASPASNGDSAPHLAAWVGYGAAIGVVGLIGDLCESLIKRDVGKKDSAPLLPGFGGVLDILDSVLYAGPIAYLLWRILPLS